MNGVITDMDEYIPGHLSPQVLKYLLERITQLRSQNLESLSPGGCRWPCSVTAEAEPTAVTALPGPLFSTLADRFGRVF